MYNLIKLDSSNWGLSERSSPIANTVLTHIRTKGQPDNPNKFEPNFRFLHNKQTRTLLMHKQKIHLPDNLFI